MAGVFLFCAQYLKQDEALGTDRNGTYACTEHHQCTKPHLTAAIETRRHI